jgi:hypothetical protein
MEEPQPIIPHQFSSSQVFLRFGFRFALLAAFAAFSNQGFGTRLATLLILSAFFCAGWAHCATKQYWVRY